MMVPTFMRYCCATFASRTRHSRRARDDLGEALVGFERVAAGRDEIDHGLEPLVGEPGIGGGGADLLVKVLDGERFGAGHAEHVLAKHVERALPGVRRSPGPPRAPRRGRRGIRGSRSCSRDEVGLGGLVHAVIRAADALHDRLAPFGAPTFTTRSTSPQSMPRSRVAVQTTALSLPSTMAGFHAPALATSRSRDVGEGSESSFRSTGRGRRIRPGVGC
jgi:hypothetical protein